MSDAWTIMADRVLSAAVAEKVMGYRRMIVPPDYYSENGGNEVLVPPTITSWDEPSGYRLPPIGAISFGFFVPDYAKSELRALEVLDTLVGRGAKVSVHNRAVGPWACWIGWDLGTKEEGTQFAYGETRPLAICRASLVPRVPPMSIAFPETRPALAMCATPKGGEG